MFTAFNYLRARYLGEKGQGIIEYAVLLAFVVGIATYVGSDGTLTHRISSVFKEVSHVLK